MLTVLETRKPIICYMHHYASKQFYVSQLSKVTATVSFSKVYERESSLCYHWNAYTWPIKKDPRMLSDIFARKYEFLRHFLPQTRMVHSSYIQFHFSIRVTKPKLLLKSGETLTRDNILYYTQENPFVTWKSSCFLDFFVWVS